jgi:membrane protease YdiL (CAAX protease family)
MAIDLAVRPERALPASAQPAAHPAPPAPPEVGEPAAPPGAFRVVAVGRALIPLALVGMTSAIPFVGKDLAEGGRNVLVGLAALTLLAALTGRPGSARLGLGLTATVAAAAVLPEHLRWWPLPGVVGVAVYLLSVAVTRRDSGRPHSALRLGRFTAAELWMVVGLVIASAVILLLFARSAPPRIGTGASFLVGLTPWWLAGVGVAFALVNAFVEEVLFRGAVQHHLSRVVGSWPAVLVQALAFGVLHLNGYPYGMAGVALASAYGLSLGALRLRSGGLMAPLIAHVCADAVIFVLIVKTAM